MLLYSLWILARIPVVAIATTLRYYIFGGLRYRKYRSHLLNCLKLSIIRNNFRISINDAWIISPYTNEYLVRKMLPRSYKTLLKGIPGYGEKYDKNSYWLVKLVDATKDDPVIIYSHGGGYFIQTHKNQLTSILTAYQLLDSEKKKKTSILLLDYTLIGRNVTIPTQLMQLHETYSKLVDEGHTNIILLGDSAGGHLSISYTQYLKSLNRPVTYPTKLILISPWVKIVVPGSEIVEGSSWLQNQDYDMVHYTSFLLDESQDIIYGKTDRFSLVHGLMSKVPRQRSDWLQIPNFSSPKYDVFMITGEDESFRDDNLEFAKHALNIPWYGDGYRYGHLNEVFDPSHHAFERRDEEGMPNTTMYIEPWGVHDACLFMETDLTDQVCRDLENGKTTSLEEIDSHKYFGLVRLVRFLNERL